MLIGRFHMKPSKDCVPTNLMKCLAPIAILEEFQQEPGLLKSLICVILS